MLLVSVTWSGTHTSVTGSVSSVRFRQTDLEMVTPVQTVQSPGSVRTVFSQFSSVSSVSSGRQHTLQSTSVRFSQVVFSQLQSTCVVVRNGVALVVYNCQVSGLSVTQAKSGLRLHLTTLMDNPPSAPLVPTWWPTLTDRWRPGSSC